VISDQVVVRGEGWNHYVERNIDWRWDPVCRSWFPDDADVSLDWHWKFFQYVFPLDDPRDFQVPREPRWSPSELAILDRYLAHSRDLAGTTVLTARNGFSVNMTTSSSEPQIDEKASARDATVGFLTMLRQCYAPGEAASFKRVHSMVAREVHRDGQDSESLKAWKRAHAAMRHSHLDHLIVTRAASEGLVPSQVAERNSAHPSQTDSPEQMISAIFYGDSIHWGEERTAIEAWNSKDAVIA
jgi:hypothetical protein